MRSLLIFSALVLAPSASAQTAEVGFEPADSSTPAAVLAAALDPLRPALDECRRTHGANAIGFVLVTLRLRDGSVGAHDVAASTLQNDALDGCLSGVLAGARFEGAPPRVAIVLRVGNADGVVRATAHRAVTGGDQSTTFSVRIEARATPLDPRVLQALESLVSRVRSCQESGLSAYGSSSSGSVTLEVSIGADGRVRNVVGPNSSPLTACILRETRAQRFVRGTPRRVSIRIDLIVQAGEIVHGW